jgi:hypothetical protein
MPRAHVRFAATALYSRSGDTTAAARTEPRQTAGGSPPFGSRSLAQGIGADSLHSGSGREPPPPAPPPLRRGGVTPPRDTRGSSSRAPGAALQSAQADFALCCRDFSRQAGARLGTQRQECAGRGEFSASLPFSAAPDLMEKLVSLAKRRGYVFQSSEIYGGTGSVWDYGPLGVELKRNVKEAWWRSDGARARRHRGAGRRDPDAPAGLGGLGPRRRVHRPAGGVPELPPPLPGGHPARRGGAEDLPSAQLPLLRQDGRVDGAAAVQPDVQDLHGAGRGGVGRGLPAPGDGAGDLRQLPERADHRAAAGALRHRADRQGVPQRDHPRQLHLPDARVRADGDAVLRGAGHRRGVVRAVEGGADPRGCATRSGLARPAPLPRAPPDKLAHYAKAAFDIEFYFGGTIGDGGWGEIEGIHNRTDFDLRRHQEFSGKRLEYIDPATRSATSRTSSRPRRARTG